MTELSFQFGTVGAPKSTPKKPGGSVGAVKRLGELGLKAFEIGWVRSVRVGEKTCTKIKETAEALKFSVSVHAPYYINLNARGEEWPKARKRLMDAAHYGNLAGASNVIFHPGSRFEQPWSEVLPRIRGRLQACIAELRQTGNKIMLRPETMGRKGVIGSVSEVLDICSGLAGAEPCLDFAHIHAREGGLFKTSDWQAVLLKYQDRLGTAALKHLTCHLSGIAYDHNGEKHHLALKESDFNLHALFEALLECGAGGRILNESPMMEDDAAYFKKVWIDMSGENYD